MNSNPILWIPSHIWFHFLERRIQAICHVQHQLHAIRPPNCGILTGLLSFLLQSVLYTPPTTSPHVNESLGLLRYRQVVDRYGMFFLHDLDLIREICLPEVLPMDDLKVLQSLGVNLQRKKTIHKPHNPDLSSHPLGEAPTWAEVERCIEEEPWKLIRSWNWSEERLGSLN
jgi:hypothetical protein